MTALILLSAVLFLFDCGGGGGAEPDMTGVYAAGSYDTDSKAFSTAACYWKNGAANRTDLLEAALAEVRSVRYMP